MTATLSGDVERYCRDIESYLCRKNDGHLVRIVGPSFERVSGWAVAGIPLKVTFRGIDRYFERYYGKGPRRRPVRIDFCEADVLDVFDEWRSAIGLPAAAGGGAETGDTSGAAPARAATRGSLPAHLERVLMRLTQARIKGAITPEFDGLVDRVAGALDRARVDGAALRGAARQAVVDQLAELDAEMLQMVGAGLDDRVRASLCEQAERDLTPFRATMNPDAFARARDAAIGHLVRERLGLPVIAYRP